MTKFPGKIEYAGRPRRMVLTDEQREWLVRWFPMTENKRLAKAMGISKFRLHCFARELSLVKSEQGMRAIRKRQTQSMVRSCERRGVYERKRGHAPSEATLEGVRRRWAEYHAGNGESAAAIMKREDPARYAEWRRKIGEVRHETVRKECLRLLYGLERKTRLTTVVLCPYKKSQRNHRMNALKRGYLLDEDCSEGSPYRYVIFYDELTQRSERFEENCRMDGFRIERDG